MRWNTRCDCTAEPPGELISSATARARGQAKARSSGFATDASVSPGRSGVENPMTPESRTTGTTGMSPRKRRGSTGLQELGGLFEESGSAIVQDICRQSRAGSSLHRQRARRRAGSLRPRRSVFHPRR